MRPHPGPLLLGEGADGSHSGAWNEQRILRMRCWQPTGKESKCAQIGMRDGGICGQGALWVPGRGAGRQQAASCAGFRCGRGVCGAGFWPVIKSRGHTRPLECASDRRRAASTPRTGVARYPCIPEGAKSPENALECLRAIGCPARLRFRTRRLLPSAHPGPGTPLASPEASYPEQGRWLWSGMKRIRRDILRCMFQPQPSQNDRTFASCRVGPEC